MKRFLCRIGCVSLAVCGSVLFFHEMHAAEWPPEITVHGDVSLSADSKPQPNVPKGDLLKFEFDRSKVFPGTSREYWVYIPKQYDPKQPACLFVCQDGVRFEAPTVFDNLIEQGDMPPTIGVFVMHGRVKAADPSAALDRYNRSYEYDGRGDSYARFLIDELLPVVETKTAPDGRPIRISKNPNDRAIGGSSSGAIAAFTAAWERPDSFRRVYSNVGTFVGLRGGDEYHTLVRKYEPKPLRIYLQDGFNDNNIYAGDWWMANLTLCRSLEFAGYEVKSVWGDGGHNAKQATALFPEAMRWLWRDWQQPVTAGRTENATLKELLIPGEEWELVADGYKFTEGPAVGPDGTLFFNDVPNSKTYRLRGDSAVQWISDSKRGSGMAFGPDGRLYANAAGAQQVVAYEVTQTDPSPTVIAEGIKGNDLVVRHNGDIYVTEPSRDPAVPNRVWLIRQGGDKQIVDTGLDFCNGVTLSPDHTLLYVAESRTRWVYSYAIQSDGTLAAKQRYFWLHEPDDAPSGADGMCVDTEGRLYVATNLGVQICDQPGRVHGIVPTPSGRVTNLRFGGPEFDMLYATSGGAVYRRKLNARGLPGWAEPVKPAVPRL